MPVESRLLPGAIGRIAPDPDNPEEANVQINPQALAAWLSNLILAAITLPAMSVIVFLRRGFGCRYMKLWTVLVDACFLWTLFSFTSPTAFLGRASLTSMVLGPTPSRLYAVAMLALAAMHYRAAWSRFWKSGDHPQLVQHSMDEGSSRLAPFFTGMTEHRLRIVIEPLAVVGVAIACFVLAAVGGGGGGVTSEFFAGFAGLGLWLLIAAVFLMFYEVLNYELKLNQYLDMVDQSIDAAALQKINTMRRQKAGPLRPADVYGSPVILDNRLFDVMKSARALADEADDMAGNQPPTST